MTDPARAAVEAWMYSECPHPHQMGEVDAFKYTCPDCLLAFAAAQRAEERAAWAKHVDTARRLTASDPGNPWCRQATIVLDALMRARREGPLHREVTR